jgi:hypothetical protein
MAAAYHLATALIPPRRFAAELPHLPCAYCGKSFAVRRGQRIGHRLGHLGRQALDFALDRVLSLDFAHFRCYANDTSGSSASAVLLPRRNDAADSAAERRTNMWLSLGKAAASLAAVAMLLSTVPASAQTQGMERRDQRRDVRQGSRAAKQACKAGDEKSRPECRQTKRATKQQLRQGGTTSTAPANSAAPANPAPAANPVQ